VTAVIAVLAGTGVAAAATRNAKQGPTMSVKPSASNLDYGQMVRVVAKNLRPKGTGYTAITICGITDDKGKPLAKPGRDDCAGTDEMGDLLIVVANDNGSIDEKYTLPTRGRRFAKNHRQCNVKTQCALVVADAAASGDPAYQVSQILQFKGQTTTTTRPPRQTTTTRPPRQTTTTTRPPRQTTTTTRAPQPGASLSGSANGQAGPSGGGLHVDGHVTVTPPDGSSPDTPPVAVPPDLGGLVGGGLPDPVAGAISDACAMLGTALAGVDGVDPATVGIACAALASGDPAMLGILASNPAMACGPLADAIAKAIPAQDAATYAAECAGALADAAPLTDPAGDVIGQVIGGLP